MDAAAKICLVGPSGSGKTAVARLLADWDTTAGAQYLPTQALRIQVCEYSRPALLASMHSSFSKKRLLIFGGQLFREGKKGMF
jgi:ABC-type glutathione transport system ATPase component